jgi:uncharacterized protein YjaG (DUF416 family)
MDDYTQQRLERLSHPLKAAFAAGCASRVLRIYELDYSEENRSLHDAVDVAWKFASGEQIPKQTFSDTLEAVEDATPDVDEEGDEYSGPMRAGVSAISALKAVKDRTARSALDAALAALEAVGSFEDHIGKGEAAEEQWQERALKLVESWGDKPIARDMFAVLGDDPPVWFPWPKR